MMDNGESSVNGVAVTQLLTLEVESSVRCFSGYPVPNVDSVGKVVIWYAI